MEATTTTNRQRVHLCDSNKASISPLTNRLTVDKAGCIQSMSDECKDFADNKRMSTELPVQSFRVAEARPELSRKTSSMVCAAEVEIVNHSVWNDMDNNKEDESNGMGRPAFISVRIEKATPELKLGITFRSASGELLIGNITPESPLSSSPLQRGDRLINLDDHPNVSNWTALEAAKYIRQKHGLISFVVQTKHGDPNISEAVVYKSTGQEHLGISFYNDKGRLRIRSISSEGLLGDTSVLNPGDFVVSMNGVDVAQVEASLVLEMIRSAMGMIALRVMNSDSADISVRKINESRMSSLRFSDLVVATPGEMTSWDIESGFMRRNYAEFLISPGFMSVKLYKPTSATKVGITFVNNTDGQLQVGTVMRQGMLGKSPITPGLIVQSMGGVRCNRWTKQQAVDFVKAAVGELVLVLQDPDGNSSYVLAMAYKTTPRSKIGISFKSSGDQLRIGSVRSDGIFWDSLLNGGDTVLLINGVPCQHLTPTEAVAITQRIPESVIVMAKLSVSNCLVISRRSADIERLEDANGGNMGNEESDQAQKVRFSLAIWCAVVASFVVIIMTLLLVKDVGCTGSGC